VAAPVLRVPHGEGQATFLAALDGFAAATRALDDHALLAASRCWGWSVVDVVTHVRLGLEEVACCLLTVGTCHEEPDTDAATYWQTPAPGSGELDGLLALRRISSATRAPTSALAPLRLVMGSLRPAVERLEDGVLAFQDRVLTTGDFLATWAVELAVHQLDLGRDLEVPAPGAPASRLARRTVEALLGTVLPVDDDVDAVLLATGRRSLGDDEGRLLGAYASRLPVL
jgi:hypothetical protein